MSADVWLAIGTGLTTFLFIVPGLVYSWYVLEQWIGDPKSYEQVIPTSQPPELEIDRLL